MTKAIPTDPYYNSSLVAWHLIGTWGLHTDKVWKDYTGEGVKIAIVDDGFQYTNPDLAPNYRTDLDWDTISKTGNALGTANDNHGTAVAGVIAADDNGEGSVGVAFDSDIYGIRIGFNGDTDLGENVDAYHYALTSDADIVNNSWGYTTPFSDNARFDYTGTDYHDVVNAMQDLADLGRDGLGTINVFSAGNNRSSGDNANYHNLQNSIYAVTVGGINENGTYSQFSNPGANILVAAGGTNVLTTDKLGVDGYTATDYIYFGGTSAAAPIVSGLIALMLEANPNLGWRDVQEILAYSAQQNDPLSSSWHTNGANNWNGGGLHFSHDYGFGAADAYTAIRLAETWTLQQTSANMAASAGAEQYTNLPITNAGGTGSINTGLFVQDNIEIEHVLVHLDIDHTKAGDLKITLISPTGMESILVDHPSNGAFTTAYDTLGIDFDFSSVAYWGEHSSGTWGLRIQDTVTGNTGTLNSWSLSFTGNEITNDDLYIYTNEFLKAATDGLHPRIIDDANGGIDTLNLSAVSSDSSVDLTFGSATIATHYVSITQQTVIENVMLGDGKDYVSGNAVSNHIYGGDGNDTIHGREGDDFLYGGDGDDYLNGNADNDTLYGGAGNDSLEGGEGNDLLIGGAGADRLNGSTGHDIFGFVSIEGGRDTIFNFTRGGEEADYLNLTDLLEGFDPLTGLINDFVHLMQEGAKTVVSVNSDGQGTDFTDVAAIYGTGLSGASAQSLLDDGTLIVNHSLV